MADVDARFVARWVERARLARDGIDPGPPREVGESTSLKSHIFDTLMQHSVDAITINERSSQLFLEVSDSFCDLTGFERGELLGRTSIELGLVDPNGASGEATKRAAAGEVGLYETSLRRRDGEERWVELSHQIIGADLILSIVRDVTDRRGLESDLRRLADTDPLTGDLNRRRFQVEVEREIRESNRFGDAVAVMALDLDGFKAINDTYGHAVGDEVLLGVSAALRAEVRDIDYVGRIGGDEFAVLLTRADPDAPGRIAERIKHRLRGGISTSRGIVPIAVSIGSAVTSGGDHDFTSLFVLADRAMYDQKLDA